MMFDPDMVLLDEPFGGINPALVDRLTGSCSSSIATGARRSS